MTPRHAAVPRGVWKRKAAWLLVTAAFFVFFCWVFDWVWFKPLIQRYVAQHAARRIDFDELHLGLTRELQPSVRLRGLTISNAPWADPAPLIKAGELQFVFAWKSVVDEQVIVTRLVLRDAEVDMERQADGHRNWRIGNPDYLGPGKLRVLRLEAERSSVRFVHQGVGLELRSRIEPLDGPRTLAPHQELPLTKRLLVDGTRQGHAFTADIEVGDVLGFFDTGAPFAFRGEARSASARLQAEGTLTDVAMFGGADAQLRVEGPRLADLAVLAPALAAHGLPAVPYAASAMLHTADGLSTLSSLQASLGANALTGELSLLRSASGRPRPLLRATLTGGSLDGPALAHSLGLGTERHAGSANQTASDPPETSEDTFGVLRRWDAQLDLSLGRVTLPGTAPAGRLQLQARLDDGQLAVDPLRFAIAGGELTAALQLRANPPSSTVSWRASLRGARAEQLLPTLPEAERLTGRLDAQLALDTEGSSTAAWVDKASGSATLTLSDATIADRLEAKLGLSAGAVLRTLLTQHRQVPLRCAMVKATLQAGVLQASTLGLATDRIAVAGRGTLPLKDGTLDLLLTPQLKQHAVLALDRSIHVAGPLAAPKIALVDRVPLPAAASCAVVP